MPVGEGAGAVAPGDEVEGCQQDEDGEEEEEEEVG